VLCGGRGGSNGVAERREIDEVRLLLLFLATDEEAVCSFERLA